jgi:hypothetical protein
MVNNINEVSPYHLPILLPEEPSSFVTKSKLFHFCVMNGAEHLLEKMSYDRLKFDLYRLHTLGKILSVELQLKKGADFARVTSDCNL